MKRILSLLLALALLVSNLPVAYATGTEPVETAPIEATVPAETGPAETSAPTETEPVETTAPTETEPVETTAPAVTEAPTEPAETEPAPTEPVILTGEFSAEFGPFMTSAPAFSAFALDGNGNPTLASGRYVRWIDRLADLPAYATDFYAWLEENADGDGSNDALISPSGSYHAVTLTFDDMLPVAVTATQAEADAAFDDLISGYFAESSAYLQATYNAFDRDHPEVFWLSGYHYVTCSYSYSNPWKESDGWHGSFTMKVNFLLADSSFDVREESYRSSSAIYSAISTRDANISSILSGIPSGTSTYETIYLLNDSLTRSNCYNTSSNLDNIAQDCRECLSALAGSVGTSGPVCEAYARAFKVLCDRLGIPCVLVDGNADNGSGIPESHMWNYVKLDGGWYGVDVTWNDPSVSGVSGAVSGYEHGDYVLVGSSTVVDGMAFLTSHPVENSVSYGGVHFTNGPALATEAYDPNTELPVLPGIAIDATNFPDEIFRSYVSANFDADSNGSLSEEECAAVVIINVDGMGVSDMTGIEHFTALTRLICIENQLTSLDVSKNTALQTLYCGTNQLTSLDISKNTALQSLNCWKNALTSLDVSKNTALKTLYCDTNQLTTLDVSKNVGLQELSLLSNQLTTLDISKNTALTYLDCSYNQLTSLDVSNNTALKKLYCNENRLTSLDVSKNTDLKELYCWDNALTSLDISKNTALSTLHCSGNQLNILDVSTNTDLLALYCQNNLLTSLDISQNIDLMALYSSNNRHPIEVSGNTFDLSTLPGFDVTKASNWVGGSISGNTLTINEGAETVTYSYDIGIYDISETFTLDITYVEGSCNHSYSWSGEWNDDYTLCTVTVRCIECWETWDIEVTGITSEILAEATATSEGRIKYTAVATFGGRDFVCTATVTTPVLESSLPASGNLSNGMTWTIDENGHMTISGSGEMPWCDTEMGAPWNAYAELIQTAELTEGITSVGPYTFYNCLNLTDVSLPSTLKYIHKYAFYWCRNLTTLDLPDGVEEIGDQAFYNCDGLESIDFGKSLRSIGYMGFDQCRALTEVTFPDTLESLGSCAFRSCDNLQKATFLGETPTIGASAFDIGVQLVYAHPTGTCGSSVTWTLDRSAKTLTISGSGPMANYSSFAYSPFQSYKDDIEKIVIQNGVTTVGDCAFGGLTALKEVSIPASVTGIGKGAFEVCTALTGISLPDSLLSIGSNAFQGSGLTSVTVPENVTLADRVFQNCQSLTSATISANSKENLGGGAYLFAGCTNLTSLLLENGVAFLPQYAFSGCTKLASAAIPGSVQVLAANVFENCTSLSDVTFGTGVEHLGPYLFQNCTSLTEITLPASIVQLEEGVFRKCTNLRTITFSGSAPTIAGSAFSTLSQTTIRYPQNDASWNDIAGNYFGATLLTWQSYATSHTHNYGDWVVTTPATCTTPGEQQASCSCGLAMVTTIPSLGHDFKGTVTVQPDVDASGETTYACSRCGESYTEEIPATGSVVWLSAYEFEFSTFAELRAMSQRDYSGYVTAYYAGTTPLVISEDFTLNTMLDLSVYGTTLQIPENVTFTMPYPCILSVDSLDVDGELYADRTDVYLSLDISGKLYNSDLLWIDSTADFLGEENIVYTTDYAILRICHWLYTTEDLKAAIAVANANTNDRKYIVLSFQEDFTLTESVTIPGACEVYTDGYSITIASGVTLTTNTYFTLTVPMTVYGQLANGYAIDVYADDPNNGSIRFADGGSYRAVDGGELYVTSSLLSSPEEALPGLDTEGWDTSEHSDDYEHWWTLTPPHIHEWDEGQVTTEPTATTPGVKTYTCHCGETYTEEIPATGEMVTWGDVNGDKRINAMDASLVLQYSLSLISDNALMNLNFSAANVNGDTRINAMDASLILQHSIKLIDKFPVEK